MKSRISNLTFILLIFLSFDLFSQNTIDSINLTDTELRIERIVDDSILNDINIKSISIDKLYSNSSQSKVETKELEFSTERGVAEYIYDENHLKKIVTHNYGEMGKKISVFYLILDQLFLLHEFTYKYNRPIYWNEKRMRENNDNETFDINNSIISEVKSYFVDGKLYRQIHIPDTENSNKKMIEEETRILTEFELLIQEKDSLK
jgi:hypothetical protein